MSADLSLEYRLTATDPSLELLNDILNRLPHTPVPSTVCSWTAKGKHGIRLPVVKIGGRNYSTEEAVNWWFEITTHEKLEEMIREHNRAKNDVSDSELEELRAMGMLD